MNNYNALINNLETLELNKIKENLDQYLDMIADGAKTTVDALYELSEMEMKFRNEQAITGCVKVANFPYLKEINEFEKNEKAVKLKKEKARKKENAENGNDYQQRKRCCEGILQAVRIQETAGFKRYFWGGKP